MPKSAKKRKDKAADFAKAKLKLGREKKAPSNVIDTSFKARPIVLPTQSITIAKDENAPTTKRKLAISDLLAHLKHYNPSVKKDALIGLNELLEAHWTLVDQHLSQLVNQLARVINDEDAGVRKQLLAFFSWLLPRLPKEDLIPHASALILFTASAQTHIFPEIRIDAVRFLALFLDHIPGPLVEGWDSAAPSHGKHILEGYLGNLSAGTKYGGGEGTPVATLTSSVPLSPASKLAVLQSFSSFLRAALSTGNFRRTQQDPSTPLHAWFISQSFRSREAFQAFEEALCPQFQPSSKGNRRDRTASKQVHTWDDADESPQGYILYDCETPWAMHELEDVATSSGGLLQGSNTGGSISAFLLRLSRTLHPVLVSTILDCAPSVFAPDSKGNEVDTLMIVAVIRIASLLYGTMLGDIEMGPSPILSELEALLSYMTPYFPFIPSRSQDVKLTQNFQDLNIIYCELTSLLVLHSNSVSLKGRNRQLAQNRQPSLSKALSMQVTLVSEYITKLLRGQSTSISQISQPLSAESYLALLPSIWSIINNSYPELSSHTTDVLQASLEHANKISSKSSAKRLTIEFVARLMLLEMEPQYRGAFFVGSNDQTQRGFKSWLIHLPQILWELGSSDPMATEVIFRILLRLLQRRSALVDPKTISALALRLVPYFTVTHPVRGQLSGPYSKLSLAPWHLRRLCLDMVFTLLRYGAQSGTDASEACDALSRAVDLVTADTNEEDYWIHVHKAISSH